LRPAKWGLGIGLQGSNPGPFMSALGQKQTLAQVRAMSALPPKADMDQQGRDVRLVPKADIRLLRPNSDELIYVNAGGKSLTWSVVAQEAD